MKTENNKEMGKYLKTILVIVSMMTIITTIPSVSADQFVFPNSAPLQNTIKQEIANGNLSVNDIEGTPIYTTEIIEKNESHIKLRSTTKITFKHPKGAGYENNLWPKFEIKDKINNNEPGVYDQKIKDSILADIQSINNSAEKVAKLNEWNNYNFESGPRTFEFVETIDATYANDSSATGILANSQHNSYILMGKTIIIKDWEYSKEANVYILGIRIAWAKVYALFNGALGLRLPVSVGLVLQDQIESGKSYYENTNIVGQDWDAAKYASVKANVDPDNGNEFILQGQFSVTGQAWARIIGNIGPYTLSKSFDYGKSFQTPIGPNEKFPIPPILLSPDQTHIKFTYLVLWAGIGIKIDPFVGTDKIVAAWKAEGDSKGNGNVLYQEPNKYYQFGPVNAGDYVKSTNYATITLSDYNYYFSICKINFDANIQGGVIFLPPIVDTPYVNIYTYDCSGFTKGLHLGTYPGTTANHETGNILVKAPQGSISITSPNGGEIWQVGKKYKITWNKTGTDKNVKIELLYENGHVDVIKKSTSNT